MRRRLKSLWLARRKFRYRPARIYLPPAEIQWSMFGVPEQIESKDTEECYWELRKFLILALKQIRIFSNVFSRRSSNTQIELAEELFINQTGFFIKARYQTYNGYEMSQYKKLEGDLRTTAQ
jgi:hypothetical protein